MRDLLSIGTNRGHSMIGTGLGLGLAGYRLNPPGVLPVLDLRFATDKSLTAFAGPTPSFSRASSGTYFDANGVLQSAGVNAARFNHVFNGTSWVSKGLLIEGQRTNICTYSEDLTNAAWSKVQLSISANAVSAPDGNTTADKLVENTSNTTHYTRQTFSGISSGATVTFSAFFKAGERGTVALIGSDNVAKNYPVLFDLVNGTVLGNLTSWGAYAAPLSSSITNVGNGWYRCVIVAQLDAGVTTASITPTLSNSSSTSFTGSYTGDGSSGTYQWGAQVEAGAFPTSYIGTTNSSVVRSSDVCQITGSDFSGFWNGTEGSVAVEYDRLAAVDSNFSSGYPRIVTAVKTSDTSRAVTLFASQSPSGEAFFVQDGTVQAWFSAGSLASANVSTKLSTGYKANDFAASLNGAAVATDASGTIPSGIDRMDIGNEYGVTRFHNGHIARLRYYPVRLSNAKLQELST